MPQTFAAEALNLWSYYNTHVCKYASGFTMHHIAWPPNPISGCVCVSLGASWVTDVCYPTPSELAQCDSSCQRGSSHRPACLWEPQGVELMEREVNLCRARKPYLAFLSRGPVSTKTRSMRGDKLCLWSSGTDRLPGLTHSKRGDEWVRQAKRTASMRMCMSAVCLLS